MVGNSRARLIACFFAFVIALTSHTGGPRAQVSEVRSGTSFIVSSRANDGFLNMRREPNASAEIVARLPIGSPVTATGKNESNGTTRWHQVRSPAGTGWVNGSFIDRRSSTKTAPAVAGYVSDALDENGTHWSMNGSKVVLVIEDDWWTFRYLEPRPGMVEEGVRRGTVLFKGREQGVGLIGTAYRFSKRCGALSYEVAGEFEDDGKLVLSGPGARGLDQACRTTHTEHYTLPFKPID